MFLEDPAVLGAFLANLTINATSSVISHSANSTTEAMVIGGLLCIVKSMPKSPEGIIAALIGVGITVTVKLGFYLWEITSAWRSKMMLLLSDTCTWLLEKLLEGCVWLWQKLFLKHM